MRQSQVARGANVHTNSQNGASALADPSAVSADGVLFGTESDDVLSASAQFTHVIGLGGNDQIVGSAENNILEGNAGNDTDHRRNRRRFSSGAARASIRCQAAAAATASSIILWRTRVTPSPTSSPDAMVT